MIMFPRNVYAIQHNVTKKIYIGSSNDVTARYWSHIYQLRSNKHNVEDMQDDFNRYGENYSLFIIDEIKNYDERHKEYKWIEKYETFIRGKGYNYKDHIFKKILEKKKLPFKGGLPKQV